KTIGLRIPDHKVSQALLTELGEPLVTSTLLVPDQDAPLDDGQEIRRHLERDVDLILDSGPCGIEPTTVVNLTGDTPVITRTGRGSIAPFAISA
ncbi:MAG TPA: Sua5/YciO/YrdC/YwlC family protein, partial [Burkholderiales bacterium]|nr:Sua5/YciO/YrdC/YwlC family protein [Burkholderiales bacterium]